MNQPIILDGKIVAAKITNDIETTLLKEKQQPNYVPPGLAVVLVGDDPASAIYVNRKGKKCKAVGLNSFTHVLPASTNQAELMTLIDDLNNDPAVHGILVQLPLPAGLNEQAVIEAIDPAKDVDGFHPISVGKLHSGIPSFISCTPKGCMELLKHYIKEPLAGKHAVVLGRSHMVGKPVASLLLQADCTVTTAHSKTKNVAELVRQADILVAAIGKARFVKGHWLKPGAIVIDVGITRTANGLVGDVDYDAALPIASAITPVPGGVGPMTIACLLQNTYQAARQ